MANERFIAGHNPNLQALLCGTTFRFATLWRIERRDGVVLRFTDHNEIISFDDEDYKPAGGLNASARQSEEGFKEQNLSVQGYIDDESITDDDLRAGRFREAEILEMVVDWRYPWAGEFMISKYWVANTEFGNERWKAELTGIASWLRHRIGRIYTKQCRWRLGQVDPITLAGCGHAGDGVDLADITLFDEEVTEIIGERKVFHTTIATPGHPDKWFRYGLLTWTSGANENLEFEIRNSLQADGKLWLNIKTPFDIEVGDSFNIYPGCDRFRSTCYSKFDNIVNYGGFPWIPGTDAMIRTVGGI